MRLGRKGIALELLDLVRRGGYLAFAGSEVPVRVSFHLGGFVADLLDEQLLRLDLGDFHVAVIVTVQDEGLFDLFGEGRHELRALGRQPRVNELLLILESGKVPDVRFILGQNLVEFFDQLGHLGDELDEPFGNEHHPVVDPFESSLGDDPNDVIHQSIDG